MQILLVEDGCVHGANVAQSVFVSLPDIGVPEFGILVDALGVLRS